MAKSTASSETGRKPRKPAAAKAAAAEPAKARFTKALDEAKAGAEQLRREAKERAEQIGKEARERAGQYREKAQATGAEWANEAKVRSGEARERAADIAVEAKSKASEGIASVGKMVEENAHFIDEKVGSKYGDYARSAARSMQDAAVKLDAKDIGELGEDAKEFVRKSPGLAIGVAAVAGFMLARLFRGSND
jgi:ElaB/YqjD/DUF883 family membrane-anchored ribosome-binding protein